SWWQNDAATAAANSASTGDNKITSASTAGGVLITYMDKAARTRSKHANGQTRVRYFCGSDFIDAYKAELRANGTYTMTGWGAQKPDGSMQDPQHAGLPLEWDPTLDDLGKNKFCYAIDMGPRGLRLMYMDGNKYKKHNP